MLKGVKKEDIPSRYKDFVKYIGFDGFLMLVQLYGGSVVYIPTVKSIMKSKRNRIIKSEFKGDYDILAKKYNMCRTQIYNIINKK